jgi:uncharacterized protein
MAEPSNSAPVSSGERIVALDLIRGIAVLGILLANVTGFGHADLAYYWPPAMPGGGTLSDRAVWLAQFVVVDGKFRGLFTLLFGAGLVLFVERAGAGERAMLLQGRRLFWLALIGLAHFFLLFHGDILFSYACGGIFALLAWRMQATQLVVLGVIWALVGAGMQLLSYVTPMLIEAGSMAADGPRQLEAFNYYQQYWQTQLQQDALQGQLLADGSYWDVLRYRVQGEGGLLVAYFNYAFFETIPLMLLGMGLYRGGVFAGGDALHRWTPMAWAGVVIGLAANLAIGVFVWSRGFPPYLTQGAFFGLSGFANLPLLLGGAVLAAQWAARPHSGWLVERLVLAGRMALSNYVGTSLVMVLLFQGWAGGLFGTLHRGELLLVVLLGWALMLTFSRLWLGRFAQGPLEWLWRCLTYWRWFPLRRAID